MGELGLVFEEMVFPRKQTLCVIYTATTEHLKSGSKGDVITVAMVTMTFQYGGYSRFKLN